MKHGPDSPRREPRDRPPDGRSRRWAPSACASGCLFFVAVAAFADDTVTLRDARTGGRTVVVGEIVAADSRRLELALPGGAVRAFDAADVLRIETPRLPAHLAGLTAWADRDAAAAREKLGEALRDEPRAWVRREILAALIPADLAAADRPAAVSHFAALYRSDPHDDALRLMPAAWGDRPATAAARSAANRWRTGDGVERFVAGSVFLTDPDRRAEGVELLKSLSVTGRGALAELARLQRWRAKALAGGTTAAETDAARRRVAALPEALRAGPTFAVALALADGGRDEEATGAFLWTATVDDADPPRAADALLRAARLLRGRGETLAAARLLREVRTRVPFGPAADEAATLEDELTGGPAAGRPAAGRTAVPADAAGP